jgi:hypothetical protein
MDGTTHEFTMPLFVFRPLKAQLDKLGERARLKLTGHWAIPKEVQDAIAAGAGLPESPAQTTEEAPARVESAPTAAALVDSIDEQSDTRAKWKTLRRPTKVYAFVDGKFVEQESGDEISVREVETGEEEASEPRQDDAMAVREREDDLLIGERPLPEIAEEDMPPEKAPPAESVAEPVKPVPKEKSAEAQPEKAPAAESAAEPVKPAPRRKSAEVQPKKAPAAESAAKAVPKEDAADKKAPKSTQATPTRDTDKASKEESPSPDKFESPGPSLEKPEDTSSSGTEEPKE